MTRRILEILVPVLAVSGPAWAGDGPWFTEDFPAEEFVARRAAVYDAIGPDGLALVPGAPSPPAYVRFRQSNELYYLSGVESPHAYLLLDGARRRATLYLPHRNAAREGSEGRLVSAEDGDLATRLTGVDAVAGVDLLGEHLARVARGVETPTLFVPMAPAEGAATSRDLALRAVADWTADPFDGRPSREGHLVRTLTGRFPRLAIKDLSPVLDRLRLIKSPREIALIRRATRLAGLALIEAMRATEPGLFEHELDAVAKFVFFRNGAQGEGYYSLVAGGSNAFRPHYHAGRSRLRDGDLLLMDFAPDVGYYTSDVTRMWPVSGRFSPWQQELYGFYLGCYRAILSGIRPGLDPVEIKRRAARDMQRLLSGWRFSKPAHAAAAREFVAEYARGADRGGLGHWVGMAVHDVGRDTGPLRPGMVFTVEPALRVPEERIYIRLEDLIVIGAESAEVVSGWVPMDIDAIEKVMAEDGMLRRHPRDAGP